MMRSDEASSCATPHVRTVLNVFRDGKPHTATDVAKVLGIDIKRAQGYIDALARYQNGLEAVGNVDGLVAYRDPHPIPDDDTY